ncbi:hypothetical protein JW948_16340 [bacterium]|nr:hypothetical protein [bacterium]
MKTISRFCCIFMLVALQLFAGGVYMKQKQHTDAMQVMGQTQPAKDVVQETWIDESGFRTDGPDQSILFNAKAGTMAMIDHQNKSVMEIPYGKDMMGQMSADMDEEEAAEFQNMMQNMMKIQVSVTKTAEKKTINGWPCTKYDMTMTMAMGQFSMEIWATEALKIDPKLYQQYASGLMAMMPGMQQNLGEVQKEMEKIKGVQVLTVTSMMMMGQNIRSSSELVEFKNGNPPANFLQIPAGYKKQNFQGM